MILSVQLIWAESARNTCRHESTTTVRPAPFGTAGEVAGVGGQGARV